MNAEIKDRVEEINRGEVPEGYKKTRVGIIPEVWEVKSLGEVLEFKNGINAKKEDYGHGTKFINVLDILNNNYIVYNNIIGKVNVDKKKLENYDVCYGDILFQRSSETIEEVGYSNVYLDKKVATFGGFVIRGKKISNYEPLFLKELLNSPMSRRQIESRAGGSTRFNIGQAELYKVNLYLPHLQEQQEIAQILATWDQAIELKERLIEEMKEQKKGLMQRLLTGESRLPGFDGEWEEVKFDDISTMYSGGTPKTSNREYYNGSIPWINSGDLNQKKVRYVEGRISKEGLKNSSAKMISKGDLLLALYGATAGVVAISEIDAAINQAILAIIPRKDNGLYLYYQLYFLKDSIINKYTQGGQPNLSSAIIKTMKVKVPTLQEQKAIAQILSTADKEIDLLNGELEQLKLQKKGLMQLLLTGIVRVQS